MNIFEFYGFLVKTRTITSKTPTKAIGVIKMGISQQVQKKTIR